MATERYQLRDGSDEEAYAVVTNRYSDVKGAIQCLYVDCGFTRITATKDYYSKDLGSYDSRANRATG